MYEYKVKSVERVIDGDTVDVILDLGFGLFKKERVRIAGVDTPEKRTRNLKEKKLGYDATAFAEQWFSEGDITIRTEKDGKYGRMLGWCFICQRVTSVSTTNSLTLDLPGFTWAELRSTPMTWHHLLLLLNKRGYDTWEDYTEANP